MMLLNFPLLTTNQKIFLSKSFMLNPPLATMFGCVNSLKDLLSEARLGMKTFHKCTESLVVESPSPEHDGRGVGPTIQRNGVLELALVPDENGTV